MGLKLRVQCQSEALNCAWGTQSSRKDGSDSPRKESPKPSKARIHAGDCVDKRGISSAQTKPGFTKNPDTSLSGEASEVASCRSSSARRAQCAVLNARTATPASDT